MAKPDIAIIGPGVVGAAIGRMLKSARYPVVAVAGRSPKAVQDAVKAIKGARAMKSNARAAAMADVVFITTPDRAIRQVCEELVAGKAVKRGKTVIHCSGAYGPEILFAARAAGAKVAALHPVQSFASVEEAVNRMKGSYFTFEGDEGAEAIADNIVSALGGKMARMAGADRALYHAALCVLSNYQVALADLGFAMLALAGLPPSQSVKAVEPLMRGTFRNIMALGPAGALTGPIARGDAETVERHLRALGRLPQVIGNLYRELGKYTVRLAQRKGSLSPTDARRILTVLNG